MATKGDEAQKQDACANILMRDQLMALCLNS